MDENIIKLKIGYNTKISLEFIPAHKYIMQTYKNIFTYS